MTILYDHAPTLRSMLASHGDVADGLRAERDNLFQQVPARGVLPPSRQVQKASSRKPVYPSRSLRGLQGEKMASVLRRLIDKSGSHLVFIDEASDPAFLGPAANELSRALEILDGQAFAGGPDSYATRVHAYVYWSGEMVDDPQPRRGIWSALTRMGGVWLEAFTGADPGGRPWDAATWATRPTAFAQAFERRGGRASQLHFLMSTHRRGDQPSQWALASSGRGRYSACRILSNGPGAYRLGTTPGSPAAWVREYRKVFPTANRTTLRCM